MREEKARIQTFSNKHTFSNWHCQEYEFSSYKSLNPIA